MIDPEAEGRAYMVALRIGAKSWPEMQRELGYDPEAVLAEIATWQQKMAKAGVILDGDPSVTTQAGLPRQAAASPAPAPIPNGNGART
jgi:capsid protein